MPPKKKIAALVKVQLQAGAATPAPPVGTALGPHGVNIMDFCKAYNAQKESMRGNVILISRMFRVIYDNAIQAGAKRITTRATPSADALRPESCRASARSRPRRRG